MRQIHLTNGMVSVVDEDDYVLVSKHKWYAHQSSKNCFYAARRGTNNIFIYLHRALTGDPNCYVDHINGNTLDNRRHNLRMVSSVQSQQNRGMQTNNVSGVKGVSFHKAARKYRAYITINKVSRHLGLFDTIEEATAARNVAAKLLFGEFARGGCP
jgi:hypothetical protein